MNEHLTPKQARFVDEYMVDLNATQAAIRAGYSERTAYSIGSENLKKPEIRQAIEARQKELAEKREWDIERLVDEAETNLDLARGCKQMGSANGALELIGKATGLLSDKPKDQPVTITRVTVVLDRGIGPDGERQIVEESHDVLPRPRPELADGNTG